MMPTDLRTRLQGLLCATGTIALVACAEPVAVDASSSFSADIHGATTERISGTATANSGDVWMRESIVQVATPIGPISGVLLTSTGGGHLISFLRSGTEIPVGTHRVAGSIEPSSPVFNGGYTVRRGTDSQMFMTDSGVVTITASGSRVSGSFTLYASNYKVYAPITPDMIGKPLVPLESGRTPVKLTGTFDAVRLK